MELRKITRSANSGRRTLSRIALGLAAAISLPTTATAQELWNIEEVTAQPVSPILIDGIAMSAAAAGASSVEAATVQVTFDYLRLGMGYLELPLPDGSTIEAENAVFEDRGGGNLMWTGAVPGGGYESVVFTVQDGHLVGWFGEPGGPKYVVHAGPDGRGSLAEEIGATGDWCGVEAGPGRDLVREVAASGDRPAAMASGSSDSRLDILVLYAEGTEHYWRAIGGPAVGVQQYSDYLNMVFRNGAIPATANLIAVRWDPELANRPSVNGYHQQHRGGGLGAWHNERYDSPDVFRLRTLHRADMVYFLAWTRMSLFHELRGFNLGGAELRTTMEPAVRWGWNTVDYLLAFPHEVGHMLGGWHEPAEIGAHFARARSSSALRPYAFGHTDLTSCSEREGYGDLLICPRTTMSYRVEAWDDPQTTTVQEPFYSSVRHKPNGWTIGVAGTSEVERVLHETVPVAARSGDVAWRAEQYPRRVTAVRWAGHDTVRVEWSADWRSQEPGRVNLALAEGANDVYSWSWDRGSDRANPSLSEEYSDPNVAPIVRAGGVQVGVEVSGLRPGGGYRIAVEGPGRRVAGGGQRIRALTSDVFVLKPRGRVSGSPAAASQVGARVTGAGSIRLQWRDNSHVETGYEVWYRKWSGREPDEVWRRYGGPLPAGTSYVDVGGLKAEEETRITDGYYDHEQRVWVNGQEAKVGRYSFVVVSSNDKGWSASETFNLEFMAGPDLEPTSSGEITNCSLGSRPTGIDLHGYQVNACLETPDGTRRRVWDYQLQADRSGLLYFFDRDSADILVKVLDGCAINGHRWVFVAPVTGLPFRLWIREPGPSIGNRTQFWLYDPQRLPQEQIRVRAGNPKDRTARTVSDTTAFPCTTAEIAAAEAAPASHLRLSGRSSTDCKPNGAALTLLDGYRVSMCYETEDGRTGDARDWGLESNGMGLLYFSDRDLVDVLIKVQDNCAASGNMSVFVAPATRAAFNLHVESPEGQVWVHTNQLGETADAVTDISAFPCAGSPAVSVSFTTPSYEVAEGETIRIALRLSEDPERDLAIPLVLTHSGGATDADHSGVPDWVTFSAASRPASSTSPPHMTATSMSASRWSWGLNGCHWELAAGTRRRSRFGTPLPRPRSAWQVPIAGWSYARLLPAKWCGSWIEARAPYGGDGGTLAMVCGLRPTRSTTCGPSQVSMK